MLSIVVAIRVLRVLISFECSAIVLLRLLGIGRHMNASGSEAMPIRSRKFDPPDRELLSVCRLH
jgi:hypothetical protein